MSMTQIIPERVAEITALDHGGHLGLHDGVCVMEAVASITGEPWSDHPAQPRHTEAVSDLLDAATDRLNQRYPLQPHQPEELAVRDVAAALDELRATVEMQAAQIAWLIALTGDDAGGAR